MQEFFVTLAFSLSITGPIFILLALGFTLQRVGWIDDEFTNTASRLVFNISLPALLFISLSTADLRASINPTLLAIGLLGTLLLFPVLTVFCGRFVGLELRGVVVQGSFRSNMGIIGLAYCINAYGNEGLLAASMYLALVTILFNILSIITLKQSLSNALQGPSIPKAIVQNPLIISILLAIIWNVSGISTPTILSKSLDKIAQLTLPLALICAGASLKFSSLKADLKPISLSTVNKLILVPGAMVIVGILLGLRGTPLAVLLLMSSAPTAAASYVMVRAMGGDARLAAAIIVATTIGSLFTTSAAITLLKLFDFI